MSLENWKLENDLCRCCHSEGSFKNLAEPFKITDLAEIYADMLKECYGIDMVPVAGMLSAVTYTICEVCIIRLRDASDFKKQVLLCEERFKDMYNRHAINAGISSIEIEVKQEIPDSEPDDDFKEEFSQDDNDDGDNDSMDMKIDEEGKFSPDEEPVKVEVRKKRKYKTRATVKSAAAKNKKRTKAKNLKEEPADADSEEEAEKKKDRVAAPLLSTSRFVTPFLSDGQVVKPKFFLRDEDYKEIGEKYHCGRCDKTCDKFKTLRIHIKTKHYKIAKYKCSICVEEFMTLPPLIVHKLEVHNVDERVKCSSCSKIFNTKMQLAKHIKRFHMLGEVGRRYKCELCDYEAFQPEHLYKHKFKHKTVKDQQCRYCKKSFKRKTTLNFHERIHTGDRRKVCTECGQAFVQKASLNYHMTKYHPGVKF